MKALHSRSLLVVTGVTVSLGQPCRRQLREGVRLGWQRWKADPKATGTDIGFSLIGQGLFWTVGQDFIGLGMQPKWLPGWGHRLAPRMQKHLPQSATIAWLVKFIEIASDATKIPIEGKLYRQQGIVPDAVAATVTQPLWSFIEVVEKIVGVILHPDRVNTREQVADSISSIYGTWMRNLLSLILLQNRRHWRNQLGHPQMIFS